MRDTKPLSGSLLRSLCHPTYRRDDSHSPHPAKATRGSAEVRLHAVLPAVIGLLRHEGRVTYRTLTYIFGLDEALLDEVREELTLRRLAVDEQGKVLVWTGEVQPAASPAGAMPHQPARTDATTVRSTAVPPCRHASPPPCRRRMVQQCSRRTRRQPPQRADRLPPWTEAQQEQDTRC